MNINVLNRLYCCRIGNIMELRIISRFASKRVVLVPSRTNSSEFPDSEVTLFASLIAVDAEFSVEAGEAIGTIFHTVVINNTTQFRCPGALLIENFSIINRLLKLVVIGPLGSFD